MIRIALPGLLFRTLSLTLVSCALVSGARATTRAHGAPVRANVWTTPHVLTISDGGDVNTLNPHFGQTAAVANLSEMTMAWLLKWDEHNRLYPELATEVPTKANGGVSADGRTITYHIRKGVKWSDGAPFDADDVVFSARVVNDPRNREAARFDQLARVDEPDKFTAVFHLKKPYAPATTTFFSSCCANPSLLPKHLLAKYAQINDVPYNALPVGIGPFTFARWDRGKRVVLVANARYWRGRPKLDSIVYEVDPSLDALVARMRAHRVDMWYQFSGAYLAKMQALRGYAIHRQPSYAYNHFDFNLTHAVVADPTVRRALRFAFDRRKIVDSVEHGVGIVQDSALPVNAPYFSDLGVTSFDLARANALLDAAGWARGADGIRAKHGVKLVLRGSALAGRPDLDAQYAIVRADFARIGVRLTVHHAPQSLMFAPKDRGGVVFGDAWDLVTFAWAADPFGDYSGIYGCAAFPPAGQNDARWCDRTAQSEMDSVTRDYDQATRTAELRLAMQRFVADVPSIVSYLRVDLFAYNRDLKNYHPNNVTPFDNMMDVDI